jgi:hypothetical protein
MKRTAFAGLIVFLTLAAPRAAAQEGGLAIRIETSQEGVHRIPGEMLRAHFPLDRIDPEKLALTHDGQSVPIEVFGASDGRFDPPDEILFFAEAPRRRHSATETYVLTDRGRTSRLSLAPAPSGSGEKATEAQLIVRSGPGAVYDSLATVRQDVIRGPALSPWFVAVLAPKGATVRGDRNAVDPSGAAVNFVLDPRPSRGLPARIRIQLRGALKNGIAQKLGINVNGTDLPAQTWDTPLDQSFVVMIPHDILRRETVVRLSNQSDVTAYSEPGNEISQGRRNDLLIERVEIIYDAQIVGPSVSGQQTILHIAPTEDGQPRTLRIEQRQTEGYLIVEPKSGRVWRNPMVELPTDREVTLAICSLGGAYIPEVKSIQPMRPTREHLGKGGDYVIVTTTDLKPAVTMLAEHRRADGFTPIVVEARELYDAFTNGAFHPSAIQKFMVAAMLNWVKKPRYLLLVGDADLDANFLNTRETLPTWLVMTDYNGFTATDSLHGDVDGDGLADVSIGRIPVRSREDFLNFARRVIALETAPPPGNWRRTLDFFAGEGRFGPVIDKLLESQAAAAIASIPARFDVQMTYGSPQSAWYWPADDFNGHLVRSFNQGALVFTYLGHGSPEAFDHVTVGTDSYRILSSADIPNLDSQGRSPVMAIIACSTGRYDDPKRDCIAEQLLLKDGGPIAVIAASRISHPYPNALLGKGIAEPFFNPNNRVGDAFRAGTRSMISGAKMTALLAGAFLSKSVDGETLVKDHAAIYNLLGDPAQKVPFPADVGEIEAAETAKPGTSVDVKARLGPGVGGEVAVSLEARRDRRVRAAPETAPADGEPQDPATRAEAIRARYAAANDHAVVRGRFKAEDGALAASLAIPAGTPPGDYSIVIFFEGDANFPAMAGSRKIRIE